MSEKIKNLVVGAGFAGATIANLIATKIDEKVIIIDKKSHIAGNSFDYKDKNNITIHRYGSHIFHTNNDRVWKYLSKFANFNTYKHKVLAEIDGTYANIPFNLNTIYKVLPKSLAKTLEKKLLEYFEYNIKVSISEFQRQNDKDLKFLADYIYEKVFLGYTIKQWGVSPKKVDSSVITRVPIYISKDDRYFQDKYQGLPIEGYTKIVKKMLSHKNIKIHLNTDYNKVKGNFIRIFYTGSIDEFFDYKFGILPYRSVNFKLEEYNQEFYQNNSVINYPCNYDFTRIHEYKYYLKEKSKKTIIAKEYSEDFEIGKNERCYPILNEENQILYNKYLSESQKLDNVYFLGRLGDYKYYDMDKTISRAIELFEEVFK